MDKVFMIINKNRVNYFFLYNNEDAKY